MNCIRNYFLISPLKGFDELEYVMLLQKLCNVPLDEEYQEKVADVLRGEYKRILFGGDYALIKQQSFKNVVEYENYAPKENYF